jgi:hypothetical protein
MSQRIGMADGRCITDFVSSRIQFDYLKSQKGIALDDNNKFRMVLQEQGPDAFSLPIKNAACQGQCSPLASDQ